MVITFHSYLRFRFIIYWHSRNCKRKLHENSNSHNFWLGCMCEAHDIPRCFKINNRSSQEIKMVITFHSDLRFWRIKYRDAWNLTRKLLANSNSHKFLLGCICQAHDISRRSKMNHGSSREIQIVITFHSDLRFRRIIYRDSRNWRRKLSANSNGHNFWLVCMCDAHDISRRSKMNYGSSRENQMVITFHSDVQFRHIIHRDASNSTWKLSENSNIYNFWLGCMCEAHDFARHSKMNHGSSQEIQMAITFHSDLRFWLIIYRHSRNWTHKLS